MMRIVIINGTPVSTFFILCSLAMLVGSAVTFARRRAFGITRRDLLRMLVLVVIGALIGGKLVYAIGQILMHGTGPGFWTTRNWSYVLGGSVFYGNLIGATSLTLLYAKRHQLPLGSVTDLMACFAPAAQAVGRVGCLCAGCCYGIRVQHMFTVPGTVYAVPRLPWPLLEAALSLTILSFFLIARPERKRPGTLFPLYLILYSAGRFVLEFFRGDTSRGVWLLSTSQWIALLIMLALAIGFVVMRKNKAANPNWRNQHDEKSLPAMYSGIGS